VGVLYWAAMTGARPLLIVNPASGKLAGGRSLARFAAVVERVLGDVEWALTSLRLAAREAADAEKALATPAATAHAATAHAPAALDRPRYSPVPRRRR